MPELAPSLVQAVPAWTPSNDDVLRSNLAAFVAGLRGRVPALADPDARDYERLHAWSIAQPAEFWAAVWRYAAVVADIDGDGRAWDAVLEGGRAHGAAGRRWWRAVVCGRAAQ